MKPVVEVEGVEKRFGRKRVLEGVSFVLPERGVTVLLGENGAGKSTLMRLVLGVMPASAGSLRVLGMDPFRRGEHLRQFVGYVADRPDCPDWMTPRELFAFLAPHYETWNGSRALSLALQYEVPLDTRFGALSRGQAARASLAAALAPEPKLLLIDEAFSGLDPLARRDLLQRFVAELAEHDIAALIATHDLDVAARAADSLLVLAGGRIAASGALEEVLGEGETLARVPQGLLDLREEAGSPAEVAA